MKVLEGEIELILPHESYTIKLFETGEILKKKNGNAQFEKITIHDLAELTNLENVAFKGLSRYFKVDGNFVTFKKFEEELRSLEKRKPLVSDEDYQELYYPNETKITEDQFEELIDNPEEESVVISPENIDSVPKWWV
jgi:hypothetical protein